MLSTSIAAYQQAWAAYYQQLYAQQGQQPGRLLFHVYLYRYI